MRTVKNGTSAGLLFTSALLLGQACPATTSPISPPSASRATVKAPLSTPGTNPDQQCPTAQLPDPTALPSIKKFPNPFAKLDGSLLKRKSEWPCRRQEILRQAEKYIYGQKPPRPDEVAGQVTAQQLAVTISHRQESIHFEAEVVLPTLGQAPYPALINLGTRGNHGGIRLGEDFILQQGVAIIYYDHNLLGKEGKPEASRGLPNPGLFYDIYGGTHSAGLLMAWAWGASRILDVLQASKSQLLDPTRIGVTGCSRNGKGAFVVGLFDERIALTIAQETSTGGPPAFRIVDSIEGMERTNHNFYGLNWLSNNFKPFVENAAQLPIDTHHLIASLAPRGLLILDNPHIKQFAASAAHTAVLAGAEVYEQLGAGDNISYLSDVANKQHCASGKPEYRDALIANLAKFLKGQPAETGEISPSPTATGNLSEWKDWPIPSLQ